MKSLPIPFAVAALVSIPGLARAIPFSELNAGSPVESTDARTGAMGGTAATAATGAAALAANPARMAGEETGFQLHLLAYALGDDERRSNTVHDSFSGYLADNIYALNSDHNVYGGGSLVWTGESGFALGFGWRPAWVVDYAYEEQVFSPYLFKSEYPMEVRGDLPDEIIDYEDLPLGTNALSRSGRVDRWTVATSVPIGDDLSVGLSLDRFETEIVSRQSTRYAEIVTPFYQGTVLPYPDVAGHFLQTGETMGFSAGIHWKVSERAEVAASFRSPVHLVRETTATFSVEGEPDSISTYDTYVRYPAHHSVGLLLHPVNEVRSRVALQMDVDKWNSGGILVGENVDVTTYRVGVEHELPGGTPFRFGFAYGPTYSGEDRNRVRFTAGSGFDAGPARVEVGASLGYATYRDDDLFSDTLMAAPARTDTDRLEERTFGALASVSWSF